MYLEVWYEVLYTAKNQQPEEPPAGSSICRQHSSPSRQHSSPSRQHSNPSTSRSRHSATHHQHEFNIMPTAVKTFVLPPSAWLLHPIGMGERMMMMMMNSPPLSTMIPTTHQVRGRVTATLGLLQRHQSVLPIHLLALLRQQAVIMRLLQFLLPVCHVNTV